MNRIIITVFLLICGIASIYSQELNFRVSVITQSSINNLTNDPTFFKDMERKISEFINTTRWTEDDYLTHEKIRGSFQLTITEEYSANNFRAELVWQTERPVYNSIYSSPIINVIDKNVTFSFNELQPLLKTTNTYYDNLSSIISFYIYYTLGMDYDSFSTNGGEAHFLKAMEIITSLPSGISRDEGWKNDGIGRRTRYWMIENVLNPRMRPFRQAFYEYHRLGLDKMYEEPDRSRAVMLSALTLVGQGNIDYPNTYLVQIFGDAKKDEIVEIYKGGDKGQKIKVKAIMVGMDFTKTEKYNALD
ncbi:MAG: DUF4835 family protein [Saprospiraceae bacterium]